MKLYQREDLVFEKVGREILVVDHKRGNLITLNLTAGFIWESLSSPVSLKDLLSLYIARFGPDKRKDVIRGLGDLCKAGLVSITWDAK